MPEIPNSGEPTRHVRAVPPEVETLVPIQVPPESVCYLSHPSVSDHRLQLDADDQGMIRFHAKARSGAEPIELELRVIQGNGQETMHTVSLSGDALHGRSAATHSGDPRPELRKVRPPLEGDSMALSNQELVTRGYPPRPDPAKAPGHYERWLRNVSQQFSVGSRRVVHPDVSFARQSTADEARRDLPPILGSPTLPLPPPIVGAMFSSNSNTWSGAVLTQPVSQFDFITAEWIVPRVYTEANTPPYSAVAKWVGLDNSGTDLFQAGTDSECFVISPSFGQPPAWTITNYWIWIQTLPFYPWAAPIPVSPGDTVSVDIFLADQNGMTWFRDGENGGLTAADNNVWFMLYNETQHNSYWGTLPTAPYYADGKASTGYTGTSAEFILERPTVNKAVAPLAEFLITGMDNCWYGDSEYGYDQWALGANGSAPFVGNLQYLNMVNPANGNLLAISVSFPDPVSGPANYQIAWWWVNYQ